MLDVVRSFLQEDDWPFEEFETEAGTAVRTAFQGRNGQCDTVGILREETRQVLFYSLYPEPIPEERRTSVGELVLRANDDLILGNFELDLDDGALRFKTSIDVSEDELTVGLLRPLVLANVLTLDTFLPAIRQVTAGEASPAEAVAAVS